MDWTIPQFTLTWKVWLCWIGNSLRSIYYNSNTIPRLWGQNCKFFTTLLSRNSQKRLEHKENQTKYRKMTRKPRSHARILIYRTWAILKYSQKSGLVLCRIEPWDCLGDAIAFFIGFHPVPTVQFEWWRHKIEICEIIWLVGIIIQ